MSEPAVTTEPRPILSGDTRPALVYCALLLFAVTHRDSVWGYIWQGAFLLLLMVGVYSTFGSTDFKREAERYPGLSRREYVLTTGIPYLLLPLIGWVLACPMKWWPGVLVPGLPWIIGYVVVLPQLVKRPKLPG